MTAPTARTLLARIADAVASPLAPSHYLALVNPLWATHRLSARIEAIADETLDARTLTLRPGRAFRRPRAGQHVGVGVVVNGRFAWRTYSITSPENARDGRIAITVKIVKDGVVSPVLARGLAAGAFVSITQPDGDFVLPESGAVRPVFISGGSGITPIMSMLRTLATRGPLPDVAHLHYAQTARDVIFGRELAALAAANPRYRLSIVATREEGARRFDADTVRAIAPDFSGRDAWACGPSSLLDAVSSVYSREGAARRLHVERFHAPVLPVSSAESGTVTFAKSGLVVRTDGRTSLLKLAERAGIAAPHGCRMGICHTCDRAVVAGCARDLRTGERTRDGERVQICVAAAAGDLAIDL